MNANQTDIRKQRNSGEAVLAGTWGVLADRSRVGFRVKKMGLYFVKGRFEGVRGVIEFRPGGVPESGELVIDAATINTRMPPRDLHLRTRDFLDVKRHPQIWLRTESVVPRDDGGFTVYALLEIHGERRPVELHGHLHPSAAEDGQRLLAHIRGTIDRRDYGIRARQPFEVIVGREVELDVELLLERR